MIIVHKLYIKYVKQLTNKYKLFALFSAFVRKIDTP